jgi:hypothetical protein
MDTGFAAARRHSTAVIGAGDRSQAEDQPIDIMTIAIADRPVRFQVVADNKAFRVPLDNLASK